MIIEKKFTTGSSIQTKFIIDSGGNMSFLSDFDSSPYDRFILVIDKNINNSGESKVKLIKSLLERHGKKIISYEIMPHESNKGIDQSIDLIKFLEKNTVGRFDLLLSIGGGFISDITSFVASIYMRGIPFVAIPTTLIGQVDAVTAGKTCINGPNTKNLLGSFYFPVFVYNNICLLDTLPQREFRQGWSEIFKYALLDSQKLINLMKDYYDKKSSTTLISIIEETLRIRLKIREIDPLASNLGHTFGHAFEKISNYKISHGDAISFGTLMAIRFGEIYGVTKEGLHDHILDLMKRFGLNTKFHLDFKCDEIANLMLKDKKSSSKRINLVLIRDIAKPYNINGNFFYPIKEKPMRSYLSEYFMENEDRMDNDLYANLAS